MGILLMMKTEEYFLKLPKDSEEYKAAEKRYRATIQPNDLSDYAVGNLELVMKTYTPWVWMPFFFDKIDVADIK